MSRRVLKLTPAASDDLTRRKQSWGAERVHEYISCFLSGGTSPALEEARYRPRHWGLAIDDTDLCLMIYGPQATQSEESLLIFLAGDFDIFEAGDIPAHLDRFTITQMLD